MSELTSRQISGVILYTAWDGKVTVDDTVISILEATADEREA